MSIPTKDFTTLVQEQVANIQGAAKVLLDFTVGSIMRAVAEANATIVLWLIGLFMQVLSTMRASTCSGSDLDSWMADFDVYRLPAAASSGSVTFSRFTSSQAALIYVDTVVESNDVTPEQFAVVADTTNPAYNAALDAYALPAGTASVTVPVVCQTAGSGGNALAGQVSVLTSSIQGVDTVSNALAFTNGVDAETDDALRARFQLYIASLNEGTRGAVDFAVASVKQGGSHTTVENYNYAGQAQDGFFYVVADDGSGAPPSSYLTAVYSAVDAVRPITSSFAVFAPVILNASVAMTITTGAGYNHATVVAAVQAALQTYINSLPLGASLPYSMLASIAYGASLGVTNVTATTLNGGTADLVATNQQVIKSISIIVS
jgi:uncharacterized phage protein gp47/JayE